MPMIARRDVSFSVPSSLVFTVTTKQTNAWVLVPLEPTETTIQGFAMIFAFSELMWDPQEARNTHLLTQIVTFVCRFVQRNGLQIMLRLLAHRTVHWEHFLTIQHGHVWQCVPLTPYHLLTDQPSNADTNVRLPSSAMRMVEIV